MLQFVICLSDILVAFQAARSGKQLWAIAFAGLAVLFNPVVTVTVSRSVFLWINVLCFTMFLASVKFLKTASKLSIPSITYPVQDGEANRFGRSWQLANQYASGW
jgi:hypothetical protein